MIIEYLLIIISLMAVIFSVIVDIKIREVPDWISYGLITAGLGLRGLWSLSSGDYTFILYGLIGFIICWLFGSLMYYTRQWGGGDAKLLMGLGAVYGSYLNVQFLNPLVNLPFLIIFLINILIAGSVYSLIWAIFVLFKYRVKIKKEFSLFDKKLIFGGFLVTLLFSLIFFIVLSNYILLIMISMLVILFFVFVLFILSKKIEEVGTQKKINVKNLREGDWPVKNIIINKKIIYKAPGLGLEKNVIKTIQKSKIKSLLIKEGIPFVPAFLAGLILSLVFGNLLYFIF